MRILVVDDEPAIRLSLAELLRDAGHSVRAAEHAPAALALLEAESADLVLSDLSMPTMTGLDLLEEVRARHPETLFVLMTAYGDERTAVKALKLGAYDYLPKPFDNDEVRALAERAREMLALRGENARLRQELADRLGSLVGGSPAMASVFQLIQRAAPTDATILITGESGTGKELAAREVHAASQRRQGPFVAFNCAALPGELVESELFGHCRGAFTGADRDRIGLMEAANGGTLFLDEVGDLAAGAQAKLLRALEERVVMPVGATTPRSIDVRLIAATNRPLERLVAEGTFREDLLYRLSVITLEMPPLRERRQDIPALAAHLAGELATRHGRTVTGFTEPARLALMAYDWPGNVRELRNALERAVVLTTSDQIDVLDLPQRIAQSRAPVPALDAALAELPFTQARSRALDAFDRSFLAASLERHGGNVSATARALGLHRQSLQKLLRRIGLTAGDEADA